MLGLYFYTVLSDVVRLCGTTNAIEQNFQPPRNSECYVQHGLRQEECSYAVEYFEGCHANLPVSGTEGIWNGFSYSNISIDFPDSSRDLMDSRLLQVGMLTPSGNERVLYHINLTIPVARYPSFTLLATYLPGQLRFLFVRKVLPLDGCFYTPDPCRSPQAEEQCNILHMCQIMMKPKTYSVEVNLICSSFPRIDWLVPVTIELYGQQCEASCGDSNPHCARNVTTYLWHEPVSTSNLDHPYFIIDNLKPANYCVKVVHSMEGIPCCNIFSKTRSIRDHGGGDWHVFPPSRNNFHVSPFFYYLFVPLGIVIVLALYIHYRSGKRMVQTLSKRVQKVDNLQTLLTYQVEPSDVNIFLVYPRKTIQFMDAMSAFRKLLGEYVKKVWDPFDAHEMENVIANPAGWLQQILLIPNVKIVLVETEEALTWFQNDDHTVDIEDQDLYISVLSFVRNNPKLLYDYERLLVVRFDKIKIDDMLLDMVPQKRYKMPHQLGLLIMDLMNWQEDNFVAESDFPALEKFCKATEDYQSCSGLSGPTEFFKESET